MIKGALGMTDEDIDHLNGLGYARDDAQALELVRTGDYDAAFFMAPTPVGHVQEVAEAGESMPPKSTYFFPKVPTGLLFNPPDLSRPPAALRSAQSTNHHENRGSADEGHRPPHHHPVLHPSGRHPRPSADRRRARRARRRGRGAEPAGAARRPASRRVRRSRWRCTPSARAGTSARSRSRSTTPRPSAAARRGSGSRCACPSACTAEQVERLQVIAAKCPVHRTLEGEVMFEDRVELVEPAAGVSRASRPPRLPRVTRTLDLDDRPRRACAACCWRPARRARWR